MYARINFEKAGILSAAPDTVVLLNQALTAAALPAQIEEKPFQILHLATHGGFSSDLDRTFIQARDRPVHYGTLEPSLQPQSSVWLEVLAAQISRSTLKQRVFPYQTHWRLSF